MENEYSGLALLDLDYWRSCVVEGNLFDFLFASKCSERNQVASDFIAALHRFTFIQSIGFWQM